MHKVLVGIAGVVLGMFITVAALGIGWHVASMTYGPRSNVPVYINGGGE